MVSGNVCNPQANPTGGYYPPGEKPSYPPPGGQPFGGPYPVARGQPPAGN